MKVSGPFPPEGQLTPEVLLASGLYRNNNTVLRNRSPQTELDYVSILPKNQHLRHLQIPVAFDGRVQWAGLLSPVLNQGSCGSCWAFASSSTLADRFNIQSQGLLHLVLSAAKLALCDFQAREFDLVHPERTPSAVTQQSQIASTRTCENGNTLYDAWRYLYVIGTVSARCVPNDLVETSPLPLCNSFSGAIGDLCWSPTDSAGTASLDVPSARPARFYRAAHFYAVAGVAKDGGSEENIRHNLWAWGPVTTGLNLYPNFYSYNPATEIYQWDGLGEKVGGHAIALVGWGERVGPDGTPTPYWIARNSWSDRWGDGGFFKIRRGTNECGIEENVVSCVPDFFYPNNGLSTPSGGATPSYQFAEDVAAQAERAEILTDPYVTGGGLDPQTGYTRRSLTAFPGLDLSRPVDLTQLPDWSTFLAGEVSAPFWSNGTRVSLALLFLATVLGLGLAWKLGRR